MTAGRGSKPGKKNYCRLTKKAPTWAYFLCEQRVADLFRTTPLSNLRGKYGAIMLLVQNLSLNPCKRQGMLELPIIDFLIFTHSKQNGAQIAHIY